MYCSALIVNGFRFLQNVIIIINSAFGRTHCPLLWVHHLAQLLLIVSQKCYYHCWGQGTLIFFSTSCISTYSVYFCCTHLYLSSMTLNPLDSLLWTSLPLSLLELYCSDYSVKQTFILLTHYPYLYPYVYFYVCFYFISHCHHVSPFISGVSGSFHIYVVMVAH